ncbi:hypothetical protein EES42_18640 [Streptomyces sp. ADI95-17]|nr:hypothetical protein EES42_18640 [Streptomyces sp. ADI95-17]
MQHPSHDAAQQSRRPLRQVFLLAGGRGPRGCGVHGCGVHGYGAGRCRERGGGRERRGGAVRHHSVGGSIAQHSAENPDAVLRREGLPAPVPAHRLPGHGIHGHPAVGPQRPADGRRAPAPLADLRQCPAVVDEGVQECVGRRVVRLPGAAEHPRHGGEGDEEVEREAASGGVEVEHAVDLRRQHRPDVRGVLREEVRVAEDARRVDDAVDGAVIADDGAYRTVHVVLRADVDREVVGLDPRFPQSAQGRPARGSGRRPAAQDDDGTRTPAEVPCDMQPQTAETARDPVDPALLQRRDLRSFAEAEFHGTCRVTGAVGGVADLAVGRPVGRLCAEDVRDPLRRRGVEFRDAYDTARDTGVLHDDGPEQAGQRRVVVPWRPVVHQDHEPVRSPGLRPDQLRGVPEDQVHHGPDAIGDTAGLDIGKAGEGAARRVLHDGGVGGGSSIQVPAHGREGRRLRYAEGRRHPGNGGGDDVRAGSASGLRPVRPLDQSAQSDQHHALKVAEVDVEHIERAVSFAAPDPRPCLRHTGAVDREFLERERQCRAVGRLLRSLRQEHQGGLECRVEHARRQDVSDVRRLTSSGLPDTRDQFPRPQPELLEPAHGRSVLQAAVVERRVHVHRAALPGTGCQQHAQIDAIRLLRPAGLDDARAVD